VMAMINTCTYIYGPSENPVPRQYVCKHCINGHKNRLWQSLLFPAMKCLFSSWHTISWRWVHTLKRCHIQKHLALKTQCSVGPQTKQVKHPYIITATCFV
jgi:hypothetical protein